MVAPGLHELIVEPAHAGERLDQFLSHAVRGLTRAQAHRLIEEGAVYVDRGEPKPSLKVKEGDHVRVEVPRAKKLALEPEDLGVPIVYEDDDIVVVNKPAGLAVHPGAGRSSGTLVNTLLAQVRGLSGIGGVERPGIVHRLDKDTSGLLVVAKNDHAHVRLAAQFKEHHIHRVYYGVVLGTPPAKGTIDATIGRHKQDRKRFAAGIRGGRRAVTHFAVEEQIGLVTAISARLETGRTHQIRVHLSSRGWAIVGDPVYSSKRMLLALPADWRTAVRAVPRQLLHAQVLAFRHPVSARPLHFESDIPQDLADFLTVARRLARPAKGAP